VLTLRTAHSHIGRQFIILLALLPFAFRPDEPGFLSERQVPSVCSASSHCEYLRGRLSNHISKQWSQFITIRCLTGAVRRPDYHSGDWNCLHYSLFVWFQTSSFVSACTHTQSSCDAHLKCFREHGSELTPLGYCFMFL
jgi:hypothetical protein